jgi:hypothetical protein
MTADIVALLDAGDLTAGILAGCDLREQRAKAVLRISKAPWSTEGEVVYGPDFADGTLRTIAETVYQEEADHIAAEANPAHALAEVALWRGIAERHADHEQCVDWLGRPREECTYCVELWPCADLTAAADAVRAYLGAPRQAVTPDG